ncbi:MAG TPA: choice-of-anchor Q domain-containing protein, partial [Lacipirellulaceae bacterium]|nr:choice-of-anchor Q domain-containing protein [Lacipirellulaceae bacterium]
MRSHPAPARCGRPLSFERLEDRHVLATFTVTNLSDGPVSFPGSAPGTLRQAVYDANHTAGADTIEFAPSLQGTINLSIADDNSLGLSALLISSPVTLQGNTSGITIARNSAVAEMRLFHVTSTGDLTLNSVSVTGGVARGANGVAASDSGAEARGGAIYNEGSLRIVASTLYGNQAIGGNGGSAGTGGSGRGGAIYSNSGSSLVLTDATLSGNVAQSGSGAHSPSSFGGAMYVLNGSLGVYNSTITNGTASTGRGIYLIAQNGSATADIWSSIIAQNDAPIQARDFLTSIDEGQLTVTGGNNLIRTQGDYQFITVSTDDPLLGPLGNNGGPTMTHALVADSPARDLGSNPQSLAVDQRGGSYARVIGGKADIGAFELQTSVSPSLPGDYSGNNVVDAADYVLWRKTLGSNVSTYSGSDGNGNGAVDVGDYGVWRSNFGSKTAAGAQLSAPTSSSP